jgi:hypothetical protein
MAIKYKKTENHTAGQQIKFTGSGGSMAAGTAPLASGGGGGGGGGGALTLSDGWATQTINAGDIAPYAAGFSATLSSTYASQAYTISTSDASYNAVSQIASGNMSVNLNTISFGDYYTSTYSEAYSFMGMSGTYYYFIATASGVSFKIQVNVPSGGGGGGGGGVPAGGGGGFGGGPA